jgi:hypothetical protein
LRENKQEILTEDEASSDKDLSDLDIGYGESGQQLKFLQPRDL